MMGANLRRAMTISDGDWAALFVSPLSDILWSIAVVGFVLPILIGPMARRRFLPRQGCEISG